MNLDNLRHSCAHLLAAAVVELWPDTKRTIGPSIENGFYYDFDFEDVKISEDDLPKIESKMREILPSWEKFVSREVSPAQARKIFDGNTYKLELVEQFDSEGQKLTIYRSGNFEDLCRGGHTDNPMSDLKNFKLLSVAGAYWKGDEKNKMLTRIYGTCFGTKEELESYLHQLEEAKKRDHRKIGKALDLFTFSDLVGSGFPLFTPKGALVRRLLNEFVEELQLEQGYTQVWTPQVAKAELFKTSGHYDKYKDDMFQVVSHYSKEEYFLKPMNCPQHTQIYSSQARSYKDLPLRYSDFAMLYRDEKPGELSGLARVRSFSQDDSHIFCREDQVDDEIDTALSMTKQVMATFGFKYRYRLSTRDPNQPEKYLGRPETWDKVEKWAEQIMQRNKIEHYNAPGEAAFYAPKMDLMATDALGREWQLSTIQIDYVMPERFGLSYTHKDGSPRTPVMLHRAIIGSSERFMMVILEHFAGALPVWLSPVQVAVLPISDKHSVYATKIQELLTTQNIRSSLNDRNEPLNARIRDAEIQKVPYILVIGDREVSDKTVTVRKRGQKAQITQEPSAFLEHIKTEIASRSNV